MLKFAEYQKFQGLNEQINYSGGNIKKMPIIGQVICKEMKYSWEGKEMVSPSVTYNVVEIIDAPNNKKSYITDKWYKDNRVPLIIHQDLVEEYIPSN